MITKQFNIRVLFVFGFSITSMFVFSQKSIIDIDKSPHAKMHGVGLNEVSITGGFWKDRQDTNQKVSLEVLWDRATNEKDGYALSNFKIAAGLKQGEHQGVPWQDAWLYKWIETASYMYASSKDESLLQRMNQIIKTI